MYLNGFFSSIKDAIKQVANPINVVNPLNPVMSQIPGLNSLNDNLNSAIEGILDPFHILPDNPADPALVPNTNYANLGDPPIDLTVDEINQFDPANIGLLNIPDKVLRYIYDAMLPAGTPFFNWNPHPLTYWNGSYDGIYFGPVAKNDWIFGKVENFTDPLGIGFTDFLKKYHLPLDGYYIAGGSPGKAADTAQETLWIRQPNGKMVPLMMFAWQSNTSSDWVDFRDGFLKPEWALFSSALSGNYYTFAGNLAMDFYRSNHVTPNPIIGTGSIVQQNPAPGQNTQTSADSHPVNNQSPAPPASAGNSKALLALGAAALLFMGN